MIDKKILLEDIKILNYKQGKILVIKYLNELEDNDCKVISFIKQNKNKVILKYGNSSKIIVREYKNLTELVNKF
jgi:hypothetical protein